MTGYDQITDLSPLHGMAGTLENLILPRHPGDIEFLCAFPKLKRLGYKFDGRVNGSDQTPVEFWADYDQAKSDPTSQPTTTPAATRPTQ